jgi:hypothetical protein
MKSVVLCSSLRNCAPTRVFAPAFARSSVKRTLAFAAAACILWPALAVANNYEYTTFSALEAVDDIGQSSYSGSGSISLVGVIINNPLNMLDGTMQWQTYLQALPAGTYGGYTVAANDFGGAAMYMMNFGNPYTASQWTSEINRITSNGALKYGDVVRVTADYPGEYYNGKFNINEGGHHGNVTAAGRDFNVQILGSTTPAIAGITLADLKDSSDRFIFDQSRAVGCEHYQASLVHLDNLQLVDPEHANWTLNSIVQVKQEGENHQFRTFDLLLGLDSGLLSKDPHDSLFSLTAILDQEEKDGGAKATLANHKQTDGYTGEYRLWATNGAEITIIPEPSSLAILATGLFAGLLIWRRRARPERG